VVALALAVAVHALDVLARRGEQPVPTPFALALALLSLAAGFALLALGVLLATRRGLRWWRLLAVAAIAVGLFWTVLPVGLAWYTTHHPASGDPGPSGAGDPGYQDVRILSTDGVSLAAWYKPAENGVTIVCLPGSNGATRRTVLPHARVVVDVVGLVSDGLVTASSRAMTSRARGPGSSVVSAGANVSAVSWVGSPTMVMSISVPNPRAIVTSVP
jgi:hypothetical protein